MKLASIITYRNQQQKIKMRFPFSVEDVENVKTIYGSQFHDDGVGNKYWTCPLKVENIEKIRWWGFILQPQLEKLLLKNKSDKINIDFYLCPLYNGLVKNNTNNIGIGENNDKWSIYKDEKSDRNNEGKFHEGENNRSPGKSEEKANRNGERQTMESESIESHQRSNEQTRHKEKTLGSINKSTENTRYQLQRWEWSRTNNNNEACMETIISMWVRAGISNPHETCREQLQQCTRCIQSRLCKPRTENSDRIGWGITRIDRTKGERPEENKSIDNPWMDCNTLETLQSTKYIPRLKGTLFKFQLEDVINIEKMGGRTLLALEMGMGKTIEAIAWLQLHPEKRPVIIVVPATLKLNWAKEIKIWIQKPKIKILSGTKPTNIDTKNSEFIIINYDVLPNWIEHLLKTKPKVLITDECHYYKNSAAKRTKAIKKIGKAIPHIIALSGTPIVNRPVEMYNAIKLINSDVIPSFWQYAHRYCNAKHNGFGWNFNGSSNTEELHNKLINTIMIRRKKEDVLTDLPDKTYDFLPIELSKQCLKEYEDAETNFIDWVLKNKGIDAAMKASNAETLVQIEVLKQIAVKGKLNQAIAWIEDFIDVEGKLVIFAVHKFIIDALMEKFSTIAVKIDGSTPQQERQTIVDKFQNDNKIKLFIGNIKVAGLGITLTASSNVAFLELPWTPGDLAQAEDRCHRIGQKDNVTVHYLLAAGTIEEDIALLIDEKRKVLDQILDGKKTDEESLLMALIRRIKEKQK